MRTDVGISAGHFRSCAYLFAMIENESDIRLEIHPNRYEPSRFVQAFKNAEIQTDQSDAVVEFDIQGQAYEMYLPLSDGRVSTESIRMAIDVLENLNVLDNQVQNSCAQECAKTGIHPENYDLYLAYIIVSRHRVTLGYYGAKVNTEWEAEFEKMGASWHARKL